MVNHSYDHPSFTGRSTGHAPLSQSERLDQLARADAAIRAAEGVTTIPWFRPPYGDEDESVRADVALAGYRYELMWTVDSLGWQGDTPDAVVRRCLDRAVPGAIYLFHVGAASTDHAALQRIIDGLTDRGYSFATAAWLLEEPQTRADWEDLSPAILDRTRGTFDITATFSVPAKGWVP